MSPFRVKCFWLSVVPNSAVDAFVFIIVISFLFLSWSFYHTQLLSPGELERWPVWDSEGMQKRQTQRGAQTER